jgi:hypothetical protein
VKPAAFEKMLSILQREYDALLKKDGKPPKLTAKDGTFVLPGKTVLKRKPASIQYAVVDVTEGPMSEEEKAYNNNLYDSFKNYFAPLTMRPRHGRRGRLLFSCSKGVWHHCVPNTIYSTVMVTVLPSDTIIGLIS